MPKPSSYPRWADVGGDIVVPSSGKQDVGWVAEEKPPAQYFNWQQNLNYQWLKHLDETLYGEVEEAVPLNFVTDEDRDGVLYADTGNLQHVYYRANAAASSALPYLTVELQVRTGRRLKAVHAYVLDNDGTNMELLISSQTVISGAAPQAAPTTLGSALSTGATTNIQKISVTGLTTTIAADTRYLARVSFTAAAGDNHRLYRITMVTDQQ